MDECVKAVLDEGYKNHPLYSFMVSYFSQVKWVEATNDYELI